MKRILAATLALSLMAGCATTLDPNFAIQLEAYRLTISSQREVEVAKARAEEARYVAMAQIAERADPQSKQMALLALALGGRAEVATRPVEVTLPSVPKTAEDRALAWASILFPTATNIALAGFSYSLARTQSNNNASIVMKSYDSMVALKPAQIDLSTLPATTDSHNIITTNTTTSTRSDTRTTNRDGFIVTGGAAQQEPTSASQDNRVTTPAPVVVPPVVVVPATPIVPIVTGP